ncbi:MAG: glutamate ABC transporter substrate-binding protein [Micrococcales bacterium]|nr:glutamate ABC transporter substrate-binding protein [Micrococcales bacterium]MCL2667544.1 glutamate ABC transporter substrate-binding protein [Micrococcales bacterium]
MNRTTRPTTTVLATLALVAGALAGCANTTGADDLDRATPAPKGTTTSAPPITDPRCNPLASYAPAGAGPTVEAIRDRGKLVVAVSADTYRMGARNPTTGEIEGFDIDMAEFVAQAVFGEPGHLQLRVITSAQRIPVLQNHEVDMVARAFTMTCERWEQIAFSAVYYNAGQKVLVAADSSAESLATLPNLTRVCAPAGTTTLTRLKAVAPHVEAVAADTHTGCLTMFQRGQVDAITGDDTVLAGLAAQDPYTKIVGEAISDEPYGLGIAADQQDFVAFVNGVLEQVKADGRWTSSYDQWLSVLGPAPDPPRPVYGR